jgi:hypothetical protein
VGRRTLRVKAARGFALFPEVRSARRRASQNDYPRVKRSPEPSPQARNMFNAHFWRTIDLAQAQCVRRGRTAHHAVDKWESRTRFPRLCSNKDLGSGHSQDLARSNAGPGGGCRRRSRSVIHARRSADVGYGNGDPLNENPVIARQGGEGRCGGMRAEWIAAPKVADDRVIL